MPIKSFLAFGGFVMLIAATYCPLLRAFGIASFDVYDMNKPYGIVILLMGIVGIVGVVLRQLSVAKVSAWISLILVVLLFLAAYFKIHHTFTFIPFKGIAGYLTSKIKYKWGWYLLFAGPILAVIGVVTTKSSIVMPKEK